MLRMLAMVDHWSQDTLLEKGYTLGSHSYTSVLPGYIGQVPHPHIDIFARHITLDTDHHYKSGL